MGGTPRAPPTRAIQGCCKRDATTDWRRWGGVLAEGSAMSATPTLAERVPYVELCSTLGRRRAT